MPAPPSGNLFREKRANASRARVRGIAIVIGVTALALVNLAYWVGQSRSFTVACLLDVTEVGAREAVDDAIKQLQQTGSIPEIRNLQVAEGPTYSVVSLSVTSETRRVAQETMDAGLQAVCDLANRQSANQRFRQALEVQQGKLQKSITGLRQQIAAAGSRAELGRMVSPEIKDVQASLVKQVENQQWYSARLTCLRGGSAGEATADELQRLQEELGEARKNTQDFERLLQDKLAQVPEMKRGDVEDFLRLDRLQMVSAAIDKRPNPYTPLVRCPTKVNVTQRRQLPIAEMVASSLVIAILTLTLLLVMRPQG